MEMVQMPLNPLHSRPDYQRPPPKEEPILLTMEQINDLFPETKYETWKAKTEATNLTPSKTLSIMDTCAICLEQLENEDDIRILHCTHIYHKHCIDTWLTSRRSHCPLCKRNYSFDPSPPSEVPISLAPPPTSHLHSPISSTNQVVAIPRIALMDSPLRPTAQFTRDYPPADVHAGDLGRGRVGMLSRFHFPPFRPSHINRRRNSSNLERGTVHL